MRDGRLPAHRLVLLFLLVLALATLTTTVGGSVLLPNQEQTTTTQMIPETVTTSTTYETSFTTTYTVITSTSTIMTNTTETTTYTTAETTTTTTTYTTAETTTTTGTTSTILTSTERTTETTVITTTETKTAWNLDETLVLTLKVPLLIVAAVVGGYAGLEAWESLGKAGKRVLYAWTGLVTFVGVLIVASGRILELNVLDFGMTLVEWSTLGTLIGFVSVIIVVCLSRRSRPPPIEKLQILKKSNTDGPSLL